MAYEYKDIGPVYKAKDERAIKTYYDVVVGDNQNTMNKYQSVYDYEAIKNSIRNIFIIEKCTVPGKPRFGNPLQIQLFDLFGELTESLMLSAVENAIEKFEPRVKVEDLKISMMPEYNRIIVDLKYSIVQSDRIAFDNLMLPFSHNNLTFLDGRHLTTL